MKGIFYKNFEVATTEAKVIWDSLTEDNSTPKYNLSNGERLNFRYSI
jgi:hypothetical protein